MKNPKRLGAISAGRKKQPHVSFPTVNLQGLDSSKYSVIDDFFLTSKSTLQQVSSPSPAGELSKEGILQYSDEVFDLNDVGILLYAKSKTALLRKKREEYCNNLLRLTSIIELENFNYPGWFFVGGGEKYEDCGDHLLKGCNNVENHLSGKNYIKGTDRCCYRSLCPFCFDRWINLQAEIIEHRLLCFSLRKYYQDRDVVGKLRGFHVNYSAVEEIYNIIEMVDRRQLIIESFENSGWGFRPIHCYVTFPEEYYSYDPVKLRKIATKHAKKCGLHGFVCIFHPYRLKNKKDWYYEGNVKYNPHFHFVGFGNIKGSVVKELSEKTGINFINRGVRCDVYNLVAYLLSHSAKKKKSKSHSYYGSLHYSHLKEVPKMPRYNSLCPTCKKKLKRVMWMGFGDCPLQDKIGEWLVDPSDDWAFYDVSSRMWTSA